MWRNYNPFVNHLSSEEEEHYESTEENDPNNLVSPNRPHQSPSASPRALLRPDPPPVPEVLASVEARLRSLPTRAERAENRNAVRRAQAEQEAAAAMPDPVVNFEDENAVDDAGAFKDACNRLERLVWQDHDVTFFFQQVEIKMKAAGVRNNYSKFQALANILPMKVIDEVKPLLCKQEADFANNDAYKQLKREILRIFGPKPTKAIERALQRTLTGMPSQLARALVNDICKKQLDCECCPAVVLALWKRTLPMQVRAGIAHMSFTKQTFNEVLQLADDIFETQNVSTPSGAVNALSSTASLDETQPGLSYPVAEVNAVSRGRGGRGGRGRGGRGGRNNRGGRGGGQQNSSAPASQDAPKHKGTKHPDLPPGEWGGCSMHFRWGRGAHFCSEPATCPWKNVFTPKPANNK